MKAPLLLVSLILSLTMAVADNGSLEIHFLDVGQGDCTFVSCPDGETVLMRIPAHLERRFRRNVNGDSGGS